MGFVNFELYVGNPSSIVISIDFSEILVRFQEYGKQKRNSGFHYQVLSFIIVDSLVHCSDAN
jgi:hypothetical protein